VNEPGPLATPVPAVGVEPVREPEDRPEDSPEGTDLPPPRLAEGTELIGLFEGSGYKEPPYLIRRADGQVVQLPGLLYLLAEQIDGRRSTEEISDHVSEALQRQVEAEDVQFLIDEKLRPLGIAASPDGQVVEVPKLDPLLALRFRARVVSPSLVRAITTVFRPLFFPLLVLAVTVGLVGLDYWLFGIHGVAQGIRSVLLHPSMLIVLFGFVVLSGAFHEIGHATALRYGGATPGVMGIGVYIVWPAFYTDVTDAYRLPKRGRVRTDLGGIYFSAILVLALSGAFFLGGFEAALIIVMLLQFEMIRQMLPLLRLDGYYLLSDLTGVPDLFMRIKPILLSLLPWKGSDERVSELKLWVRVVVTLWVVLVVPVLLFNFSMILLAAPRIFATGWSSFRAQLHHVSATFHSGDVGMTVWSGFQLVVLLLPAAGIVYTTTRISRRVARKGWQWSSGRPGRQLVLILSTLAVIGVLAYVWSPPSETFRPIGPRERWTVADVGRGIIEAVTHTGGGGTFGLPSSVFPVVPVPAVSPSPSPSASSLPSPAPSPSSSPSVSPSPSSSALPSPSASPSPSPGESPSPTPSPIP
jgi:putative peptide zinc metalloprotease protein